VAETPREIVLSNVAMDLRPQPGEIPLAPVVYALQVQLTDSALNKAMGAVVTLAKGKLPVDIELEGAEFTASGAEVTVAAGLNRFLKARATAVLDISAVDAKEIAVDIQEIRALGKLSIEGMVGPMIDKALDKVAERPGIRRDPSLERGLLIDPNALLASQGVPLEFAQPGGWTVGNSIGRLTARYAAG
jgi:hypothetical protein